VFEGILRRTREPFDESALWNLELQKRLPQGGWVELGLPDLNTLRISGSDHDYFLIYLINVVLIPILPAK
jgi:hypothetical protein